MGLVQTYYALAFAENERLAKEAEEEAKRRESERHNKGKVKQQRQMHPAQGKVPHIPSGALSQLVEEMDEEGGL